MSRSRLPFALGIAASMLVIALSAACSGGPPGGTIGASGADGSASVDVAPVTRSPVSPTPLTPPSQPPPPRAATPEPTPADATPPPTPASTFSGPPVTLADRGLSRRRVEAGEPLDARTGLFIADTTSGGGDLWTLPPELRPAGSSVFGSEATLDGRFIQVRVIGRDLNTSYLADGETGTTFELATITVSLTLQRATAGRVLLDTGPCAFTVVELRGSTAEPISTFEPPGGGGCGAVTALFSDDGERLFLFSRGNGAVTMVDVATGVATHAGRVPGGPTAIVRQDTQILVAAVGGSGAGPAWITLRRFTWDGAIDGETVIDLDTTPSSVSHLTLSPDGSSVAWQDYLPLAVPRGLGGSDHWPVVTVADARTGEVRFRVVRASLTNGVRTLQWLSDGSALVIATEAGFALLAATTGVIEPLPFGPVGHFAPIPIPAPDDPSLFAYDGRVVDASGEVLRPVSSPAIEWGERWWAESTYRWGATSEQLQFTRFQPLGRDFGPGGVSPLGLPARVEFPPFADEVQLRAAAGEAVSLRRRPDKTSPPVEEIPAGVVVTVVNFLDDSVTRDFCGGNPECSTTYDRLLPYGEAWWLHVRTEDGVEGWVRSSLLEWVD